MPDRSARTFGGAPPMRDDVPIPDVPPFTAFIGNLTFETEEDELRDFFQDLSPTSVRLVKDPQGKPKGFGYVEFAAQAGLKSALERSGANLAGRSIRVNVAEARECEQKGVGWGWDADEVGTSATGDGREGSSGRVRGCDWRCVGGVEGQERL